jgi:hypothetical protein
MFNYIFLTMKKKIYKLLLATVTLLLGVGVNAQDASVVAPYALTDVNKAYGDVVFATTGGSISGREGCATNASKVDAFSINSSKTIWIDAYVASTSNSTIEKIELMVIGNSSSTTGWDHQIWASTSSTFDVSKAYPINFHFYGYKSGNCDLPSLDMPEGTKSVRLYRQIQATSNGDGSYTLGSGSNFGANQTCYPHIFNVYLKASAPSVKLSNSSVGAASQEIMQTESLDAITYTLAGGATNADTQIVWDGTGKPSWITVDTATEGTITISGTTTTADAAGAFTYTITPSDGATNGTPVTGTITLTAYETPAPEITLTSAAGTDAQKKKAGVAITTIEYTIENADDAEVTGLPAGDFNWSYAGGKITINGTPAVQATYPTDINYTITTTALAGYTGAAVTKEGKITVKDPDAKNVAFLYTSLTPPTGAGKIFPVLDAAYDVTVINITSPNTPAQLDEIIAEDYDLIVLHEAVGSQNNQTTAVGLLGGQIGQIPMLNMKSHMYGKTNSTWPAGAGNNNDGALDKVSVIVNNGFENHQIFTGVTIDTSDNNRVTMANSGGVIRYATGVQNVDNIAINGSGDAGNVAILEDNTTGPEKYMMIALSAAAENMTEDGLLVIKNACDYLMGIAPAAGTEAKILTFSIDGTDGTIDEDAKTISVVMPVGTTDLTSLDVTLTMSRGASLTAPASQTGINFTSPVTFTVQSEDGLTTADYIVTVTVASNPAPTIAFVADEDGNRTVEQGEAITDIMFVVANAGGDITVEGLPTGLDIDKATGTISGTVDAAAEVKVYTYTVSVPAMDAGVPAATISGAITVNRYVCNFTEAFPYEIAPTETTLNGTLPCWMDGDLKFDGTTGALRLDGTQTGSDRDYRMNIVIDDATELGVISIRVNATGGRTFSLLIDDVEVQSGTARPTTLTYDASALTGNVKITVKQVGGGGSTIENISFAKVADPFTTGTPVFDPASDVITENSITIAWEAYTDAATYTLTVKDADGSSTIGTYDGVTGTSQEVTGLSANTTYTFELVAYKADGTTASQTASTTRTTEAGTGIDNASLEGKVYAANGAIIVKAEAGDAVAVFTVSGQKVLATAAKGEMSIPVAKGAYIVKLNNAHKVVLVK